MGRMHANLFFKIRNDERLRLFIYLFLAALGLCAACRFSLVAASGGYYLLWCTGFSLWWLLFCGAGALGVWASVVVARGL